MTIAQIGEYRELTASERHESLMQRLDKKEPIAIAEMFDEALSDLTDARDWLERINQQFDKFYPEDGEGECVLPELLFWEGVCEAIKPLADILEGLEAIEKLMPKKTEPVKEQVP